MKDQTNLARTFKVQKPRVLMISLGFFTRQLVHCWETDFEHKGVVRDFWLRNRLTLMVWEYWESGQSVLNVILESQLSSSSLCKRHRDSSFKLILQLARCQSVEHWENFSQATWSTYSYHPQHKWSTRRKTSGRKFSDERKRKFRKSCTVKISLL